MLVTRKFSFDAAHFLTNYYGKCEQLHGHTYGLEVTLEGAVQNDGLVIDFVLLKRIVKKHVLDKLDHKLLNDVIVNPSAENVVRWIWEQLEDLPALLKEEMGDANLGDEIKRLLQDGYERKDVPPEELGEARKVVFDKELRLDEVVLWETVDCKVVYRGE